jgi:transcriptional regulator with PAS, ATPase and Fis domain
MFVGGLKTLTVEQLIKMAIDKYKSVKLAAKVLDISQPSMSRKYKKIP